MQVTVRFFAGHRERAGTDHLSLELPERATVASAFQDLARRIPALGETEPFTTFARNRQLVDGQAELYDGDELALLQPVSGGQDSMIEITATPLSLDRCVQAVELSGCGAIVTFIGTVRDNSEGKSTDHLEYEAYREMAEEVIGAIVATATHRWKTGRLAVQHRVGRLDIGEASVVVAVSAPHRDAAFDACRYVIDELKTKAPIWKKEFGEAGEVWVGGPAGADR